MCSTFISVIYRSKLQSWFTVALYNENVKSNSQQTNLQRPFVALSLVQSIANEQNGALEGLHLIDAEESSPLLLAPLYYTLSSRVFNRLLAVWCGTTWKQPYPICMYVCAHFLLLVYHGRHFLKIASLIWNERETDTFTCRCCSIGKFSLKKDQQKGFHVQVICRLHTKSQRYRENQTIKTFVFFPFIRLAWNEKHSPCTMCRSLVVICQACI